MASSVSTSYIVIPARLQSTRLPRKLLLRETGKSVLQHTFEAASRARKPLAVWVAADDREMVDEVRRFGGQVQLTDPHAASGTDRVAELARRLPEADIIVNVQGDEPEISAEAIDGAIEMLERDPQAVMATLATPIRSRQQWQDPACVKVVCDASGRAMYFSRSPIPFVRDWDDGILTAAEPRLLQHIGLYAYRREFLLRLASMPPAELEQLEKLEQLRVLAAGHAISVRVGGRTDDRHRYAGGLQGLCRTISAAYNGGLTVDLGTDRRERQARRLRGTRRVVGQRYRQRTRRRQRTGPRLGGRSVGGRTLGRRVKGRLPAEIALRQRFDRQRLTSHACALLGARPG